MAHSTNNNKLILLFNILFNAFVFTFFTVFFTSIILHAKNADAALDPQYYKLVGDTKSDHCDGQILVDSGSKTVLDCTTIAGATCNELDDGSGQASCVINCKSKSKSSCSNGGHCKLYDAGDREDSRCVVDNGALTVSCGRSSASGNPEQFCYSDQCCIQTGATGDNADFCKSLTDDRSSPTCAEQRITPPATSSKICEEYESNRGSQNYYGECSYSICENIGHRELKDYSASCTGIGGGTSKGFYCCEVKLLVDPEPTLKPGTSTSPAPTHATPPSTIKGWCADGSRNITDASKQSVNGATAATCNIDSSPYVGTYGDGSTAGPTSYCHSKAGSPNDFFYKCPDASTPLIPGYCSNSTKTSTGSPVNNGCGAWNDVKNSISYESTYNTWCHDNYGKNDSQSDFFYKCPAATPTPTPTITGIPPTPTGGAAPAAGTCQPGNPVETCLCPGTGNCSASTGGPAYTNWGCFTYSGDARCCPNDRRYACSDGTCKVNLVACNASIPTVTPNPATTGCAPANPSAPTTGYECSSTTYAGCLGGKTCKSEVNSKTGCMCTGSGPTATPTTGATPAPAVSTATPVLGPINVCDREITPTNPCRKADGTVGSYYWDSTKDPGQCETDPWTYKYNCR
ncbi:MAG: hypothetical protein Q7T54_05895 [Candidatus Levybacteria bacterium]|nr:hypothetical protein [Candidatus Levybacteria bacterium]